MRGELTPFNGPEVQATGGCIQQRGKPVWLDRGPFHDSNRRPKDSDPIYFANSFTKSTRTAPKLASCD
jgi:hypothetical protein